jgi:hypothetical protein
MQHLNSTLLILGKAITLANTVSDVTSLGGI